MVSREYHLVDRVAGAYADAYSQPDAYSDAYGYSGPHGRGGDQRSYDRCGRRGGLARVRQHRLHRRCVCGLRWGRVRRWVAAEAGTVSGALVLAVLPSLVPAAAILPLACCFFLGLVFEAWLMKPPPPA